MVNIASIAVSVVPLTLRAPFTTSFGTYQTLQRPFVVIETDDGRRGVGEIPTLSDPAYKAESDPASVLTSLESYLLPAVMRAQSAQGGIADVATLRNSYLWIKGANFAKSGIEAAYWDLAAQEAGQPLWQLWGGTRRTFPVGVSIGGKTLDQVLERADHAVALGYRRLKVKIWPEFDVQVARALREQFPDLLIQVDANSAYNLTNWQALKDLDAFDLLLIEQPLYDDDIVFHSQISRELQTPICLDESIHSLRDVQAAVSLWQQQNTLDRLIINIKPPRVSGFDEAIAIARYCQQQGVRTWIGGMLDSAWGKAFNLNLNGLDAIDLPGDHFSPGGAYFEDDIVEHLPVSHEGRYSLTDGISTGLAFDWERFEQTSTRTAHLTTAMRSGS